MDVVDFLLLMFVDDYKYIYRFGCVCVLVWMLNNRKKKKCFYIKSDIEGSAADYSY